MEHSPTMLVAVALEIVGLFFLAREVYKGHQMEEINRGLDPSRRLQFLFATQDFRGFYIASRLDKGDSPQAAQRLVSVLAPADIRKAAEDEWAQLASVLTGTLKRWDERTTPAAMRWRRRALFFGTALLMIAAALHAFR